jgi:hypothetical protein
MRNIIETVKLAAQYFPGSPETVSDVFQVETRLRAEELFKEGQPVTGTYTTILQELPETISAEDKTRLLGIVVDAWKQYRLEGGDRLVRNGSVGTSGKR